MKKGLFIFSTIVLLASLTVYKIFFANPLVSVILLTYNRADMLPKAIDSVLAQTYKNWELIIINDGSTDNSKQIITEYALKEKELDTSKMMETKKLFIAVTEAYLKQKVNILLG